jgi:hypothetical protein
MTQFILHVGPHKTGTSYLQEAFAATRPLLAERGILYPTTWGMRAHHILHTQLQTIPNPQLERQFAEMRDSGQPVVLISVEGLTTLPEETVAYLRTLIGDRCSVRVVFYARSWGDILPSHWKQAVRAGETQTLLEYLYVRAINPAGSFFVNFGIGLRRYANVFGSGTISIVSYDSVVSAKRDLFRHFAATFLDWRDPPEIALGPVNVSPSTADVEIIRVLNSMERVRRGRPPDRLEAVAMADAYLRRAPEFAGSSLSRAFASHTVNATVNETGTILSALHRQLFAEFGQALVPPNPKTVFFSPRRADIPYVHHDYLLFPGVVDALREIHWQVRADLEQPAAAIGRSAA